MSIPQWMKTKKIKERLVLLLIAFGFTTLLMCFLFFDQGIYAGDNLRMLPDVLKVAITGLPIAFVLWLFRTSDTTENLFSSAFYKGVELLYGENTIDSGVDLLIGLSEDAPRVFDDRIKNAFTQILIKYVRSTNTQIIGPRTLGDASYAIHIVAWCFEKGYVREVVGAIGEVRVQRQLIKLDDHRIYRAFETMQHKSDKEGFSILSYFQNIKVTYGEEEFKNIEEFFASLEKEPKA